MVALYGGLTAIMVDLGLSDRLVGRTEADSETPAVAALPVIGTHMRPNLERILAVRPDLVLQMAGRVEATQAVEQLTALHLPVAVFDVQDFPGLFAAIGRIGVLTGQEDTAKTRIAALQKRLDAVANTQAGPKPTVLFEVRSGSELAAGRKSMVNAVIAAAGGTNVVTEDKKLVRLSDEALLAFAPQVCLTQRGPMNPEARSLAERPQFANLPCVRAGRAYVVEESLFSRPGPQSINAVEHLAKLLSSDSAGGK